ncbi:hypothetical protein [Sphingomonas asaccharolytica]|uniref:hypothetical protein n=1 Tax=Sphingomonas asaccharolytica TaxID=40681 RepID=UPI0008361CF8|nr:hypothetical protein [Sphingomonas asaccharolytica]
MVEIFPRKEIDSVHRAPAEAGAQGSTELNYPGFLLSQEHATIEFLCYNDPNRLDLLNRSPAWSVHNAFKPAAPYLARFSGEYS